MSTCPEDVDALAGLTAWKVLESLGESMAIVNPDYRVMWIKEPLLPLVKPDIKTIGNFCYSIFADRSSPCDTYCPVRPVFATGKPHSVERYFIDHRGVECWREARAYPIMGAKGKVAFVARISFDITEKKKKLAIRRQGYEKLERALEEMNRRQLHQHPLEPSTEGGLTSRELEVLRLLAQGLSKPQISRLLGISANTVKRHVANIFDKLGVNDRAQAAVWAARQRLI